MRRAHPGIAIRLLALAAVLAVAPARAGLGEPAVQVAGDHAAMGGRGLRVTPSGGYDISDFTTGAGVRVREFTQGSGPVFAVAFSGQGLPDLKVLLGAHYATYLAESAKPRLNHRVFNVDGPGLVLRIVQLPRGFAGTAHVPALVPPGFKASDLR